VELDRRRRADGLRSLLSFYAHLVSEGFTRAEGLEPVISEDLKMSFPHHFHSNVRRCTLEALQSFNSRVAEFVHEEDFSVATMSPAEEAGRCE